MIQTKIHCSLKLSAPPLDTTRHPLPQLCAVPPDSYSTNTLPIDVRRYPSTRRLAVEYISNFSALESFFSGDPADDATWETAISIRNQRSDRSTAIAPVLKEQQHQRGAPAPAIKAAALLEDPRCVAVVTGQQAGLFGGPLYTLLKAISAIRLARRTQQLHGVPTVAVFWVDAEDHDLDEIRSCDILDADHKSKSISLPINAPANTPASSIQLSAEIERTIDELATTLPHTDFTPGLISDLRKAYAQGNGLVTAFAIWLEQLLGELGLIVFDASDPAAKPFVRELFSREINHAGTTSLLAQRAGERLRGAGFHAQVSTSPETVALFLQDGNRRNIRTDGTNLRVGNEQINPRQLLDRLQSDPSCLSPNVLLRPIVQDQLFPTICYVAGPSELSYLGQLKDVYEHFSIPMPLIAPRLSVTLVDVAVIKFLNRTGLDIGQLQPQDESALNRLLGEQLPSSVEETMLSAKQAIRKSLTAIGTAVVTVDATLAGAAESSHGRMERELRNLQNKVLQAAKRRDQTLRRQFSRAQSQLFPLGSPQERAVGLVYFLNRYGSTLIERLISDPKLDTTHHWIIAI